jgi:adenylate cyclase class 2
MSTEVELKFQVGDFDQVRERLAEHGCAPGHPVAEENLVFDTPDRSLAARGILLRVRGTTAETVLTVKVPVKVKSSMKVREEYETVVQAGTGEMTALLEALGYAVVASYHKTRRSCRLQSVNVCLDTLRFGRFVELEGASEGQVNTVARKLRLDPRYGLTESYLALAAKHGLGNSF